MSDNFQPMLLASKQINAITAVASVFARSAEKILAESQDFQFAALKNNSAWFSKIVVAKNMSELIQAQTEHVKAQYDASVSETRKFGELLTDITRDAFKSVLSDTSQNAPASLGTPAAPVATVEASARRKAA